MSTFSECPVCFSSKPEEDAYGYQYVMCSNGHHVCSACYKRVKTCPVCRAAYDRASCLSNAFLEAWTETEDREDQIDTLEAFTAACATVGTAPDVKFAMCQAGHSVCLCCSRDEKGNLSCVYCGQVLTAPFTRNLALELALEELGSELDEDSCSSQA